jgi:hypothetical protein
MKTQLISLYAVLFCAGTVLILKAEAPNNLASSILTEGLAQRILNTDVQPASVNTQPDGDNGKMRISYCSYKGSGTDKNPPHLDLQIRQSDTPANARALFESTKMIYRGQDVAGVGDAAFRSTMPPQLHVLKGRSFIIVTAGRNKADPSLEESAASEVLRRLRD